MSTPLFLVFMSLLCFRCVSYIYSIYIGHILWGKLKTFYGYVYFKIFIMLLYELCILCSFICKYFLVLRKVYVFVLVVTFIFTSFKKAFKPLFSYLNLYCPAFWLPSSPFPPHIIWHHLWPTQQWAFSIFLLPCLSIF